MPVKLGSTIIVIIAALVSDHALANCSAEISSLMSKDTEKMTTRYQRIAKQIEQNGSNPKLVQDECRIARQLRPRLEEQLAALKQSGCRKDPQIRDMIADLIRGHEDDLAVVKRSAARSECR